VISTENINKAGRNATVTSMIVCLGFIVCWSSNQIIYFLRFIECDIDHTHWFYQLIGVICLCLFFKPNV